MFRAQVVTFSPPADMVRKAEVLGISELLLRLFKYCVEDVLKSTWLH